MAEGVLSNLLKWLKKVLWGSEKTEESIINTENALVRELMVSSDVDRDTVAAIKAMDTQFAREIEKDIVVRSKRPQATPAAIQRVQLSGTGLEVFRSKDTTEDDAKLRNDTTILNLLNNKKAKLTTLDAKKVELEAVKEEAREGKNIDANRKKAETLLEEIKQIKVEITNIQQDINKAKRIFEKTTV